MIIAGIGVGIALAIVTFWYTYGTGMDAIGIVGLTGLVTLSPAAALSLTRNRYWHGLAVGMVAGGLFIILVLMSKAGV